MTLANRPLAVDHHICGGCIALATFVVKSEYSSAVSGDKYLCAACLAMTSQTVREHWYQRIPDLTEEQMRENFLRIVSDVAHAIHEGALMTPVDSQRFEGFEGAAQDFFDPESEWSIAVNYEDLVGWYLMLA